MPVYYLANKSGYSFVQLYLPFVGAKEREGAKTRHFGIIELEYQVECVLVTVNASKRYSFPSVPKQYWD